MSYLLVKAAISGLIIAIVSEIARRNAGFGALVASLPLVSVLGMIWLWRDTRDAPRMIEHSVATFWFVVPSLPMFLLLPAMMKRGAGFWPSLGAGLVLTICLYSLMTLALRHWGVRL